MTRRAVAFLAICVSLALASLAGCSEQAPGSIRPLGQVDYTTAFDAARGVLSRHYEIATAQADTGTIQCQPRLIESRTRIIGSYPSRQVARLALLRDKGGIAARLSIAVQRDVRDIERNVITPANDTYSSVPNDTPAQSYGATTPQQNQTWRTERYAAEIENQILSELYDVLHSGPLPNLPASSPAIVTPED